MSTPNLHLYGIPNCDSVKKARQRLAEHGVAVVFHDFKKLGVPIPQLDVWLAQLGWQQLLNRQGSTWRKLEATRQNQVVDASSARQLMLEQPSVIKRPVIEWPDRRITVGLQAVDTLYPSLT